METETQRGEATQPMCGIGPQSTMDSLFESLHCSWLLNMMKQGPSISGRGLPLDPLLAGDQGKEHG